MEKTMTTIGTTITVDTITTEIIIIKDTTIIRTITTTRDTKITDRTKIAIIKGMIGIDLVGQKESVLPVKTQAISLRNAHLYERPLNSRKMNFVKQTTDKVHLTKDKV